MIDKTWLINKFDEIVDEKITILPSEWAEKNRTIAQGLSPVPGPYRNDVAPYIQEILDLFYPWTQVQEVVIMKGRQVCATVGILENIIGYTIDHDPAPMMYVTADKNLAENSIELRVDSMIEQCGLSDKIFSQSEKKHNKNTGNTKSKKEFAGGFLLAVSARSPSSLRSISTQKILFDEIDGAPKETGKEGSFIYIAKKGSDAFETTRKILYISTPAVKQTSNIEPLFLLGDQRYFFLPCPKCGHYQILKFENLKRELDETFHLVPGSVHYQCEECSHKIKNSDKVEMLKKGEWRPTAKASRPNLRSYHISSLYSPVGFTSWTSIMQEWIEANAAKRIGDITLMKAFINLTLGETWVESGEAPNPDIVSVANAKRYSRGDVPDPVLFLTLGADVQGNRIELEVVGWGRDLRSWSIDYIKIEGTHEEIKNSNSKIWEKFEKILLKKYYKKNTEGFNVQIACIDCRYEGATVKEFCSKMNNVYPIMGAHGFRKWKKIFQVYNEGGNVIRYDLHVDSLKDMFYMQLKKGEKDNGELPEGYCSFPSDYDKFYYRMLTAEEKVPQTNKFGRVVFNWTKPKDRRNEALDCRVYALAAVHILADQVCCEIFQTEAIFWPSFWDYIETEMKK